MRPWPDGIVGHQEPLEVDPVGRHALAQQVDGPAALFGVSGESAVVGVDPGLLVAPGLEGPGGQGPRGRHDGGSEGEGDAHLE